jgi:hypothetical protein
MGKVLLTAHPQQLRNIQSATFEGLYIVSSQCDLHVIQLGGTDQGCLQQMHSNLMEVATLDVIASPSPTSTSSERV